MIRLLLGLVAAMIVVWVVVSLSQFGSLALHPPGLDFNPADMDSIARHVASAPVSAMALVVGGWALASFLGGLVAAKLCGQHARIAAMLVGLLVTLAVVATVLSIKHPLWMSVLGVLLPVPLAFYASTLALRKRKPL